MYVRTYVHECFCFFVGTLLCVVVTDFVVCSPGQFRAYVRTCVHVYIHTYIRSIRFVHNVCTYACMSELIYVSYVCTCVCTYMHLSVFAQVCK